MSEDLRKQLQTLEDDYVGQPLVVQQTDLREINRIRAELGMSLVDAQLKEMTDEQVQSAEAVQSKRKTDLPDHSEAREIYEAYLKTIEELKVHQAYADQVCKATAGSGQTPVRPLATMGTNGGPLLCDHCGKAIVLEGGQFHGVTADVAWQQTPNPRDNWTSYILGGLVVDVKINGTLRIYHGYLGANDKHCCNAASKADKKARENFQPKVCPVRLDTLLAFLEVELPQLTREERIDLRHKIMDTMFSSFDPGIGRNRPGA